MEWINDVNCPCVLSVLSVLSHKLNRSEICHQPQCHKFESWINDVNCPCVHGVHGGQSYKSPQNHQPYLPYMPQNRQDKTRQKNIRRLKLMDRWTDGQMDR
ncbi:MAG: hypothetical protein EZS28_014299 [Streblomastix strix]|uniref:Uncharacterized protein n=1 Tax=Streblomastix strix TaxID=222440 RepID=A0A5J4W5B9_9EUKA|nr:MAG: hypothetical protein EZS28_014299 [Streblomastix strix]